MALEEEAALAASDGYGYEVEDLRGRLAVQLAGHVDDAVGEMQVDDCPAVSQMLCAD